MSEEVMTNTEQAVDNTQPAGNGKAAEKTFTQEEVNRIVSDRLARERTKAQQPTPVDEREQGACLAGECFELSRVHREKQELPAGIAGPSGHKRFRRVQIYG